MRTIFIGMLGNSSKAMMESIINFLHEDFIIINVNELPQDESSVGAAVSKSVLAIEDSVGIVICGNGFGVSKEASIHDDITVINCVTVSQAISGRKVNNANVLALGSKMVTDQVAKDIVTSFLNT